MKIEHVHDEAQFAPVNPERQGSSHHKWHVLRAKDDIAVVIEEWQAWSRSHSSREVKYVVNEHDATVELNFSGRKRKLLSLTVRRNDGTVERAYFTLDKEDNEQ